MSAPCRHVKWHENRGSVTKKQLWSRHMNFLQKKSRKFEIPAVRLKEFLQSCTCVSLTRIKNINITWHLVPLSVYPIRKPSVADILHSLFTYTPVRDDPNALTGSQTYLLLKSKITTGSEQT